MLFLVVTNGKRYDTLECPDGVNPDVLITETYPPRSGWIFVGGGQSPKETASIIDKDRAFRRTDSY
jgi:hypothetical protein